MRRILLALPLLLLPSLALAHPIPSRVYDRTVTVRLSATAIVVEYHLEVDPLTVLNDVADLVEKDELIDITSKEDLYSAFRRESAPILAYNLLLKVDDREIPLEPVEHRHEEKDHVRFDFRFRAALQIGEDKSHYLTFRENTFSDQKGRTRLSFEHDDTIEALKVLQPSEELKTKPLIDFGPGDEARSRLLDVTFTKKHGPSKPAEEIPLEPSKTQTESKRLTDLLFQGPLTGWLLMLALVLGAGHALTPGHGKTLVAAYLVGERGTVWHALFLGIVTTLAHTGAVLLVAAVLPWIFPSIASEDALFALELSAGLLVFLLGLWLLVRRVSGKADHVHIGGGHHHHHHGHEHEHHHHHHPEPGEKVRLRDLIVLGVTGGIVPCPEAIALLGAAIQVRRVGLALPLLLAFSAGLAMVLVVIGIGVVFGKERTVRLLDRKPWFGRVLKALPILSAMLITLLGLWMCRHALNAG